MVESSSLINTSRKRVFIGCSIDEKTRVQLKTLQNILPTVVGQDLIAAQSLHMTIIPPWDERTPDAVLRDFSAIDSDPVTLSFEQVVYGPNTPHDPALIMLRAQSTPALEKLYLQVWRATWSRDPQKAPMPHITLMRFPAQSGLPKLPVLQKPLEITFDRVSLFEVDIDKTYPILGERILGT